MNTTNQLNFQLLCTLGKPLTLQKNTTFSSILNNENAIYCLEEGLCALVRYTHGGEEIIYHYFKPGDIIGGVPFNLSHQTSSVLPITQDLCQLYTKTKCKVSRISFPQLKDLIVKNPDIGFLVNECISRHFISVITHFHSSKEDHTPIRLCRILLDLADYKDGEYIIEKCFNYTELSKYLGVHSVTISRIMLVLKNMGIIDKRGHSTIIKDVDKLLNLIDCPEDLRYATEA
ncbi:MAG: Crp/Fnr family transcriptional regulator [Cellulosilyticaceae bacterium]